MRENSNADLETKFFYSHILDVSKMAKRDKSISLLARLQEKGEIPVDELMQSLSVPGLDINKLDDEGNNLFLLAIKSKQTCNILKMFISNGADYKRHNLLGQNALNLAVAARNADAFRYVLSLDREEQQMDRVSVLEQIMRLLKLHYNGDHDSKDGMQLVDMFVSLVQDLSRDEKLIWDTTPVSVSTGHSVISNTHINDVVSKEMIRDHLSKWMLDDRAQELLATLLKTTNSADKTCDKFDKLGVLGSISSSKVDLLKKLIKLGLDITQQDLDGNAFLLRLPQCFSPKQYHEIVEFIVQIGAGHALHIRNKFGRTPVHSAVFRLELLPKTIDFITRRQSLPDVIDPSENTVKSSHVDLNTIDMFGNTIIHSAVYGRRSVQFLQYLVDHLMAKWSVENYGNASNNDMSHVLTQNQPGDTILHILPLFYSADEYHTFAKYLIQKNLGNAFVMANRQGATPLHIAVRHLELMPETLDIIANGHSKTPHFDINVLNLNGETILHSALRGKRSLGLVQQLVKLGTDWNIRSNHNTDLAKLSAEIGLIDHLRYFVKLGCDINELDNDDDNALHYALRDTNEKSSEIVLFLVRMGVQKDHQNKNNNRPLQIALEKGITDERILKCLR